LLLFICNIVLLKYRRKSQEKSTTRQGFARETATALFGLGPAHYQGRVRQLTAHICSSPEDINANTKGTPIRATASGHFKNEFQRNYIDANLIRVPRPFSSLEEVTAEINSWRTEGDSYKSIVTELGCTLLDANDMLDANLSDAEVDGLIAEIISLDLNFYFDILARQLFPSYSPTRATRLTSAAFLRILGSIAPNNEVEWFCGASSSGSSVL
jgi:hypothetical protein